MRFLRRFTTVLSTVRQTAVFRRNVELFTNSDSLSSEKNWCKSLKPASTCWKLD